LQITKDELLHINQNRRANRQRILEVLKAGVEVPEEHECLIELSHMGASASGYADPEPSSSEKASFIRQAVVAAERAIALEPNAASSHYWYGVSRAYELNLQGLLATIFGVGRVKSAAERAVELNEGENQGGPLRLRGMLKFKLPFFLGGSKSKGLADVERASQLFPDFRENYVFLAQMQESVSKEAAVATLKKGLALPANTEEEQEARWQKAMEEQLARLV